MRDIGAALVALACMGCPWGSAYGQAGPDPIGLERKRLVADAPSPPAFAPGSLIADGASGATEPQQGIERQQGIDRQSSIPSGNPLAPPALDREGELPPIVSGPAEPNVPIRLASAAPVYGPSREDAGLGAVAGAATAPGIPRELEQLVARMSGTYPSVRAAKANIRAARLDVRAAKQLQLPSLSLEGVGFTGGSEYAAANNVALNLAVDQPIWAGGRIKGNIRRAKAQYEVAVEQLAEERRRLQLRAIDAYYNLAQAVVSDAILQESLSAHEGLVDSIGRRVDARVSPLSDLTLARSRTAQIKQQLAQNAALRYSALQTLQQLVGSSDFDFGLVPVYDPLAHNPSPEGLVDRAISCDPTLARLAQEEELARADAQVAKAQIFPQVGAQFSSNEITGQRVGLVVRAQTAGGFSQVSAYNGAQVRVVAAGERKGTQARELRQAIQSDLLLNISTRDQITSGADASLNAREVTESYRRQFVAGKRTWLDVMNAVREGTNAELSVGKARVDAMASNARLLLRACVWQPEAQDAEVQP